MHSGNAETSLKITLLKKAQHEGALTPTGIIRRNPQVPHTAREVTCHPVNNWRGKQSSIPPLKTRPDSPVPILKGPCDRSPKWRGTLRFLEAGWGRGKKSFIQGPTWLIWWWVWDHMRVDSLLSLCFLKILGFLNYFFKLRNIFCIYYWHVITTLFN